MGTVFLPFEALHHDHRCCFSSRFPFFFAFLETVGTEFNLLAGLKGFGEVKGIPVNRPDLIGSVPIFEFQNRKKSEHSDFQEEKNYIFLCNNMELGC